MILAFVCAGVLSSVAYSREMIYSNNSREKASDKAQFISDEIIVAATGVDPAAPDGATLIATSMNSIANNASASDIQTESIGVVNFVSDYFEPTNSDQTIQYKLEAIPADVIEETDTEIRRGGITEHATVRNVTQMGWKIAVRVYYKEIGGGDDYRYVDVEAFAPKASIAY